MLLLWLLTAPLSIGCRSAGGVGSTGQQEFSRTSVPTAGLLASNPSNPSRPEQAPRSATLIPSAETSTDRQFTPANLIQQAAFQTAASLESGASRESAPKSANDEITSTAKETEDDLPTATSDAGEAVEQDFVEQDFQAAQPLPLEAEPSGAASLPGPTPLQLQSVLQSTVNFYPEIEAVSRELEIAEGALIQAQGGFDTKLKASSENTPVGFYETYRSKFGVERPTFEGGSVFAGYRFGRGDIEPWYLERNTNELGELKLGANWALLRGRQIDARRVALWQAELKQQAVQPIVMQQLIKSTRDAEIAYWKWVATGQAYQLTERLLQVAKDRVEGINQRIEAGDLSDITRTDNDRSILSREVKLIQSRAKLEQAAIKLSLYYRDVAGVPITPTVDEIPAVTELAQSPPQEDVTGLIARALACRPEINLLDIDIRKIGLDIEKAQNDLLPELNAQVSLSQDFGDPTSASAAASSSTQSLFVFFDEKDEFQVDASVFLSQSLQRRKATGKIRSLNGKLQQLRIKQQFLQQKIEAEVRQNFQLTTAASEQIEVAAESLKLARRLSSAARDRYEEGDVDLFEIILREQQELDSAAALIESQLNFYANRAILNASIGCDPLVSGQ